MMEHSIGLDARERIADMKLDRRLVAKMLLAERGDLLVVGGLGAPANDVAAAGDHALDFPLWGGMGGAAMIGLGLAMAQPARPVLVLTGDGEMLMGLGALATIGVQQPANLAIVVLDNEHYGETGMQPSHTERVDLVGVARACTIESAQLVTMASEIAPLRTAIHARRGPHFAQVKVSADRLPFVLPPRDGAYALRRFRDALLGPQAHAQR